jgi:hypothetical protein
MRRFSGPVAFVLMGVTLGLATPLRAADLAQTLDSVDVYAPGAALKMRFDDSRRDRYASGSDAYGIGVQPAAVSGLMSCVRAPNRDLVCLEGALVRSWPDAEEARPDSPPRDGPRNLFSCTDANLGLVTRGNPCTALTVDPSGTIWLAGSNRKSSFSVIKVVPVPNTTSADCPAPYGQFRKLASSLTNNTQSGVSDYCVAEYATGRPVLEDISYVGGDSGAEFRGPDGVKGPGVLIMEQKLTVSFIPDPEPRKLPDTPFVFPVEPKVIGGTRGSWGLNRGEDLQSAAVFQRDADQGLENYVLASTNQGRLLAKSADGLSDAFMVFDTVANRRNTQCSATAVPRFAVRTRYESGRVYVSDAACREVQALEASASCVSYGGAFSLCNAREFNVTGTPAAPVVSTTERVDVTLSTSSTDAGAIEPFGLSVSPGIGIDLNDCARGNGGTCVVVPDGNANAVGAQLSRVTLVDRRKSGLTMYQVVGMPDCRYPPHRPPLTNPTPAQVDGFTPTQRLCHEARAIVTLPAGEFLDVSGLLPAEIRKLFDPTTNPLPSLLVSPIYAARPSFPPDNVAENDYLFEAFFGRTEDDVVFRQTFDFEIDAPELTGDPFDCGGATPGRPDLSFNVITTISERFRTVSGLAGSGSLQGVVAPKPVDRHVDMLVTTGCRNPQSSAGNVRLSVFPYNLAVVPSKFPRNRFAPAPPATLPSNYDQYNDVYARLLVSLFDDLGLALDSTARVDVDGNGQAPLGDPAWRSLKSSWLNAEDKLQKCVSAAYDKRSAADQTCQAFFQQISSFRGAAAATIPTGPDRANRVGELVGRADVIVYVLGAHFLPSIPVNGFYNPDPT